MNDRLHDALNEISDKHLNEAETYQNRSRTPYWFAAVAALLIVAIGIGAIFGGSGIPGTTTGPIQLGSNPAIPTNAPTSPSTAPIHQTVPTQPNPSGVTPPEDLLLTNLVAAPKYPKMVQRPNFEDFGNDWNAYNAADKAWRENQKQQYSQPDGYADSLTDFFYASMAEFLQGDGNPTYSPLNVYMAMAMLAETTGSNSRQQILDLFGVNSIEELRTQAGHVWNAHDNDDGETTLLMANSLWLDHRFPYRQEAADTLAQYYYASTFHGDLGTATLNQQLRDWLNANTGGLLKDQANNVELSQDAVFALASTIYFTAGWTDEFSKERTYDETFHTPTGDIQTPFMHQTRRDTYYRGTNFGAICLKLGDSNRMWLILPDEGYTTEDILQSDEYLRLTLDPGSWYGITYEIHLSLPKFDVVQQQDLIGGMQQLGITDVFNSAASDFSPISDMAGLFISQINHAARVTIDEEGCTAAAFTVIDVDSEGIPGKVEELHFTLDRPFLFIISSRDNLPLFSGIVNEP